MRDVGLKRYIINKYKITGATDRARHGRRGTAVAFRPHRIWVSVFSVSVKLVKHMVSFRLDCSYKKDIVVHYFE